MAFDQYHEPAAELSEQTRTFARMCANLTEEAEAIGWYERRMSIEPESRAIMSNAVGEDSVDLYLEQTFSFRVASPEAVVPLATS